MNATIKRMAGTANLANSRLRGKSLEKLAVEYGRGKYDDSVIVAVCWEKLLGIIIKASDTFYSLAQEEKASIAQVAIVRTLQKYRIGQGTKFSTLFYTVYRRSLITALKRNTKEYTVEDIQNLSLMAEEVVYDLDTGILLKQIGLWLRGEPDRERLLKYCEAVMEGNFDTITQLAEQLDMSRTTIYAYQKRLKVLLEEHDITG